MIEKEEFVQEEFDIIDDLADDVEDITNDGDLFEHLRVVVDAGQSMLRIDKYLTNRIENATRNKIQESADSGFIKVNGVAVKSSYRIKPKDIITLELAHPPREIEIIPQDIPLDIVYEDDSLLVINKSPGMVVHPGHGNYSNTLVNALAWHLKDNIIFQKGDPRPGLVHRIDKDTSGLLVVAKTELAKIKLAKQFFDKSSSRTYQALVWGNLEAESGTVVGNIGRSLKDRLQMTVFPDGDYGKHAVTHYRVLERLGYVNLIECKLETGRTHQIRAHMKYLGHTLFNDERYGGNDVLKGTTFAKYKQFVVNCFKVCPRQALHAKTLGFIHPTTNEFMSFDSELPNDMVQVIEKWRGYISNRDIE